MRHARLAVLVVVLLAVLLPIQASAGPEILGAISGSLWSSKDTVVQSNPEQCITWSSSADEPQPGEPTAKYRTGGIEIPVGKYPIFPELSFMRIDVEAFGIKPEFMKSKKTAIRCSGRLTISDCAVVVDVRGLDDTQVYYLVTSVVQNQGRHDEGGLLPVLLQLFGRKKHSQVESTDFSVRSFVVSNTDGWVEDYCETVLGGVDPAGLTIPVADRALEAERRENLKLIRAQYYLENFREKLSFSPKINGADWYAQAIAARRQGFRAPLASAQRGLDSAQSELQGQINDPKPQAEDPAPKAIDPPAAPDPAPTPAKINWRLVLPQGKWGISIAFGSAAQSYQGPYTGAVDFNGVSAGEVRIQLVSGQTATEWRSATPSDQQTISWQTMKEVR